jgi:TonB family protein
MSTLPRTPLLLFLCALACSAAGGQTSSAPPPPTATDSQKTTSPDQPSAASPADSTKLEPVKIEKASYPWEAREKQLQGQVWVRISVSEAGDVVGVEVISGDPILAKAAVQAAKKWKFKPFIRNGKPVPVSGKMPFDFAFSNDIKDVPSAEPKDTQPSAAGQDPAAGAGSQPVKVSSGLISGLLIHKVNPVYPVEARQAGIQGVVILQAEISAEGRIVNLHLITGPPELAKAAIGAVEQWRYRPYMLMGKPVAVQTQVQVNFTLSIN